MASMLPVAGGKAPFGDIVGVSDAKVRVILCMIVRNESAILDRCLRSAAALVDAVSICDTGSTDYARTSQILFAGDWASTKDAEGFKGGALPTGVADTKGDVVAGGATEPTTLPPVRVYHHAWRDFGHNRSLSFAACRQTCDELGWDRAATFALFLDADMELVLPTTKADVLAQLGSGSGGGVLGAQLRQSCHELDYWNQRLARLDADWVCVGVTHECWHCRSPPGAGDARRHIADLHIADRGDGGCKADKFERDRALLERALADEPGNTRYLFYLAQTLDNLGLRDEAAAGYAKHTAAPDAWDQEAWCAKLRLGKLYLDGNTGRAKEGADEAALVHWLLAAFDARPSRAEPLHVLARHFMNRGMHAAACLFAQRGLAVPYPAGDILFVERAVYAYELLFTLSVSAYYVPGLHAEGRDACLRLLAMDGDALPAHLRHRVRENLRFYTPGG